MKVAFFSVKSYDREFFRQVNERFNHEIVYFESRLQEMTAPLAQGFGAICVFVNDEINAGVIQTLAGQGTGLVALRCSGFNNVDLCAAQTHKLRVARVPAYSPYSVAEHAVALMLALNRKLYRAYNRVREGNFTLDGLLGFEIHGMTVGVIGTGRIGACFTKIIRGFGAEVIAYDPVRNPELESLGVRYLSLEEVFAASDIISLHLPLLPETHHLINGRTLELMKKGVMILNTSRGALIDTPAVIDGLKSGRVGSLALDVYEEEANLFFKDLSGQVIQDDVFARLLTFPSVLITGHQGFFTGTAMRGIAEVTLQNIRDFEHGTLSVQNEITCERIKAVAPCDHSCGRP